MKKYIIKSPYEYGEMQIEDPEAKKTYTLTDRKVLFHEDFYSVTRFLACENVDINTVPESDFYLYMVCYMGYNCTSTSYITTEENIKSIVGENLEAFLRGRAWEVLKNV